MFRILNSSSLDSSISNLRNIQKIPLDKQDAYYTQILYMDRATCGPDAFFSQLPISEPNLFFSHITYLLNKQNWSRDECEMVSYWIKLFKPVMDDVFKNHELYQNMLKIATDADIQHPRKRLRVK